MAKANERTTITKISAITRLRSQARSCCIINAPFCTANLMGGNRRKGAFFTYFLFDVIDKIKETTPANAAETGMIRVVTPPDEYRLAHDIVFRN